MVKVAIAGANSSLARHVIDKLVEANHQILALVRKDPADFPALPGVEWAQTTYEDNAQLVSLLRGWDVVISFVPPTVDPGNVTQKRIIDATVEAGVKRFAPSDFSVGAAYNDSTANEIPWYTGKLEIAKYLEDLNKDKKVIEYTRFQVGAFLEMAASPYAKSPYLHQIEYLINIEKKHALLMEGSLDDEQVYTSVDDIAGIVALAVAYEGEWPVNGGIIGDKITNRKLIEIGEKIRGQKFELEFLKKEDLEAGILNTPNYLVVDLPAIPKDQVEVFSKMATRYMLTSMHQGLWNSNDEWNRIFPDYKFIKVEEYLTEVFEGKP